MTHVRAIARLILLCSVLLALFIVWLFFKIPLAASVEWSIRWRNGIVHLWSVLARWIMGVHLVIEGTPPSRPFCLVANHLSYLDALVVQSSTCSVMIAKSEIASWPIIGALSGHLGTIFIDRKTSKDVLRVNDLIRRALDNKEGVVFFPEGTSSEGRSIGKFHSSLLNYPALVTYPVHYAAISYASSWCNASEELCWWGDMTFAGHFYNVLRHKSFKAYISFGKSPVTHADRKELTRVLESRVAELFVPVGN